jgi:hypothetical protein
VFSGGWIASAKDELQLARASETATRDELHQLELKLARAEGETNALRGRLSSYSMGGGGEPVPLLRLMLLVAVAVVALIVVLLVVSQLLVSL